MKGHFGAFFVKDEQVGGCLFWGITADGFMQTADWFFIKKTEEPLDVRLYEAKNRENYLVHSGQYTATLPPRWTAGRWQRASIKLEGLRR